MKGEIGKLPEKEFRIMLVKMIRNLENKMEKIQESINKDLLLLLSRFSRVQFCVTPETAAHSRRNQ